MIKTKKKIFMLILVFIIAVFFPKNVNAKYLNVSAPANGQPGSVVNVSISTDCIGRFNISVTNGTLNGENKYWLENSSATFSVTLGQSGITKIDVSPALPVSLNKVDINDLASQSKSITINNNNSGASLNNSSGSSNSSNSNTSSSKTVKMIETSPVDFSGFKTNNKGPYKVTVENNVSQLNIYVKYSDGSKTYTKNLQEGSNKISVDGYTIIATRKTVEGEVTPNEIDEKNDEENKEEEKKNLRLDNLVLDDNLNVKLEPNFNPEVFEYTVILGNDYLELKELYISALPNIDGAKVTIEGNKELTDTETTITIKVEAEGYETATYTIKVVKQEIVETEAEPVLEETDDILDNSKELMKKRIIISSLVCLITFIGIIFIAKECYESTNDLKNKKNMYEEEYNEKENLFEEEKNDFNEENNILEDLYKIKNDDKKEKIENNINNEEKNKIENSNEKIEDTQTKMDEFFSTNTRIEFSEGRTRRKRGKGKHS